MPKEWPSKYLRITMTDGSKWEVPVRVIAKHRAEHYKHEFGNDLQRSLDEDTMPLFIADDFEIEDWAANNMDWNDVSFFARKVKEPDPPYFDEGWRNGEKEVVER